MSEEQKQPTITNPFGDRAGRVFVPAKRERSEPVVPKLFMPSFYVSQASQRYIIKQIETEKLTANELPLIYQMAQIIGNVFRRPLPTISDIEVAVQIRTVESARQIAQGEKELDIIRHEVQTQSVMPKKERIELWKTVAAQIVEIFLTHRHEHTEDHD